MFSFTKLVAVSSVLAGIASASPATTDKRATRVNCSRQDMRDPWSGNFDPRESSLWAGISRCCQGTISGKWLPQTQHQECTFDVKGVQVKVSAYAYHHGFWLDANYCESFLDNIVKTCVLRDDYGVGGCEITPDANFQGCVSAKWRR